MKLFEEYKLYEDMWDGSAESTEEVQEKDPGIIHIDCTSLTEGIRDKFADLSEAGGKVIVAKCLQFLLKADPHKVTDFLIQLLEDEGLDSFGELEAPPYSLNKHRIAAMMKADLERLSAREWASKWYTGFLHNGDLQINPADYPDMDLSALAKVSGTFKRD